jgi:hypothetical protein
VPHHATDERGPLVAQGPSHPLAVLPASDTLKDDQVMHAFISIASYLTVESVTGLVSCQRPKQSTAGVAVTPWWRAVTGNVCP